MIQEPAQHQWTALDIMDLAWFHGLGHSDLLKARYPFAYGGLACVSQKLQHKDQEKKACRENALLNGRKQFRGKALLLAGTHS